jgi:hypothetical protein
LFQSKSLAQPEKTGFSPSAFPLLTVIAKSVESVIACTVQQAHVRAALHRPDVLRDGEAIPLFREEIASTSKERWFRNDT